MDDSGDYAGTVGRGCRPPVDDGKNMNFAAIPRGAMIFGGAVLGGAVIGGGIGAVKSLKGEGVDNAFSRQDGRDTLANVIVGAGVGAAAGVALLGAKKLVPALGALPIVGQAGPVASIGLGMGVGAAGLGAFTLARNALD